MITIENVVVSYNKEIANDLAIIKHSSLIIEKGEWLSLIGPSGSGKTSFLKLLGGLLAPTSGNVMLWDHNLYQMNGKERHSLLRKNVGFVYQQFRLLPQFSVLKNVMLPLIPYEKKKNIQEKAAYIIEKIGLAHRMKHLPHELSGGEQQRVAFARALLTEPSILLCDEPTGNLDRANRDNILELLHLIHQEGCTIILATHDPVVASKSQRIIEIEDGSFVEREIVHG